MKLNFLKSFFITLTALTAFSGNSIAGDNTNAAPRFKNVIMVVFENENPQPTLNVPFFKQFAQDGVYFDQTVGEARPSQPNYLAMVAGDTFGVTTDSNVDLNATHLGDLLENKKMDWKVYAEDYPGNCYLGKTSGDYARKHVPFLSFTNVSGNKTRCAKIVNFSQFQSDWANHRLPQFTMVIPNNKNNGHDTSVDYAGSWFQKTFAASLKDPRLMADTLFIATFDEGSKFNKNQYYTAMQSPKLKKGVTIMGRHDHYSLLKLIEDEWGLGNLGRNDKTAPVINGLTFLQTEEQ